MSVPLHENPFAVLTAIVAPAVLTNACSVLCLGIGTRIARVVDRTRALTEAMPKFRQGSPQYGSRVRQLERLQRRAQFLVKALGLAASALISVIGAASAYYGNQLVFRAIAVIALAIGVFAVTALVAGCVYMVHETRLAVHNLTEEAQEALTDYSAFE
jgi:hypothetical protein